MQLGVKPMGTPQSVKTHIIHCKIFVFCRKLVTHKELWGQAVTTQGTCGKVNKTWWVERALYLATKVECESQDQTSWDSNAVKCTQIDTCTQLLATTSSGNTCDPQELRIAALEDNRHASKFQAVHRVWFSYLAYNTSCEWECKE